MDSSRSAHPQRRLGRLARQRFVEGLCAGLPAIDKILLDFLTALMGQTATQREMHQRRDIWQRYQDHHRAWTEGAARAWRGALAAQGSSTSGAGLPSASGGFELVSDEVVENRILASRLALSVAEHLAEGFDPVRQRTQLVEGQDLGSHDILRADTVCLRLVEQWVDAGLPRGDLQVALDPLRREFGALLLRQYQDTNRFYEEQGVALSDDLRSRVRRATDDPALLSRAAALAAGPQAGRPGGAGAAGDISTGRPLPSTLRAAGAGGSSSGGSLLGSFATPLARARQRAQGVMGQLRRMLLVEPGMGFDATQGPRAPSPALAHALSAQRLQADGYYSGLTTLVEDYSPAGVAQVAGAVRQRSADLKKKAASPAEKAIIEVVALMFQSILSEDRIPPSVRVWFARLQVPVLRVALAEPEFFSDLNHPARQLIDRMGACVLGFDAAAIGGSALEAEIRRVVQVIEQYPETGHRVFQLVYEEFEKFLARFLTERQTTSRIVSVAQQVEQKETMAIQYTIELRTMLKDMPVRDEIRDFLFKTWAEVLALSAVRRGAQDAETVALKRAASDLVWAAGAKPHRADRSQVIQSLPGLLQTLRNGLALIGVQGAPQDAQIKMLTDTLADAFLSKTASIPQARIDAMARRLANLEDYMSDATLGEIPLSADHIEMMLGIDASSIHVIADNGAPVRDEMVAWAQELQRGTWFTLDHNGASAPVQYVWHSQRRQLHLFAAVDGSSYLLQLRRLGAYLQAGLLVAQEEEGLTVRATREALAKLDANPERLLD